MSKPLFLTRISSQGVCTSLAITHKPQGFMNTFSEGTAEEAGLSSGQRRARPSIGYKVTHAFPSLAVASPVLFCAKREPPLGFH